MAVKKIGEKYYCAICGNEVEVTKAGGGILVCCGQNMELVGAAAEKAV
ncbi:MAG: desulfoferrodoxin FeS4 iron-binding domain-containing protein [Patescibacteria group bacterium]|jgi:desulfoferrodoxin-like iron-binding protein